MIKVGNKMIITVEKMADNQLSIKKYSFMFFDKITSFHILFEKYIYQTRATKKHKFKTHEIWSRIDKRQNTINDNLISLIVTPDIITEAKAMYCKKVLNTEVEVTC